MICSGRGSGLGLVLAKEIIALHGGSVIVESEEGSGSVFGFCIPFELASAAECVEPLAEYRMRKESDSSTCVSSHCSDNGLSLIVPSCEDDLASPLLEPVLNSPLRYPGTPGIQTPILDSRSSGIQTPILDFRSSGIQTPILDSRSSGIQTPILSPGTPGIQTPILHANEPASSSSISFHSPTYSSTLSALDCSSNLTSFENSKVNSEVGSDDDGLRDRYELEPPYLIRTCLIVDGKSFLFFLS